MYSPTKGITSKIVIWKKVIIPTHNRLQKKLRGKNATASAKTGHMSIVDISWVLQPKLNDFGL